jgi:hypothetical protein
MRSNQTFIKTKMKISYSNENGTLPEGERIMIIGENIELSEFTVVDPFDREWKVPKSYVVLL